MNGPVGFHSQPNTHRPVLIIGRKGSFGKINYSDQPCFAIDTTYYIDARNSGSDLRWLFYALLLLRLDAISEDSAIPGLSRELAHYQRLPSISLPEQRAIAAFLDRETAKINALIEKKERLIELLQEKRAAIISHAVTKGLDPTVPMKDLGVEWLGEIPAHWNAVCLKYLARLNYGDSLPADVRQVGEVPVFGSNGPVGFHSQPNTHRPVLIIGRKGSFGKINYSDQPCFAIDTTYYIDARNSRSDLRWLFYALLLLRLDAISEDSAIPGLSRELAHYQRLPSISLPEQRAIAAFLDRETAKIDALISRICEGIEKLKEYSSALVSAAVTGKIDVRGEITLQDDGNP